jgi:hypothetical protein
MSAGSRKKCFCEVKALLVLEADNLTAMCELIV